VIDVSRLLAIQRKAEMEGPASLTPEEAAGLDRASAILRRWWERTAKSSRLGEEDTRLGMNVYELLPESLQQKWRDLKPYEFGLLARVFPEEIPSDVRRELGLPDEV